MSDIPVRAGNPGKRNRIWYLCGSLTIVVLTLTSLAKVTVTQTWRLSNDFFATQTDFPIFYAASKVALSGRKVSLYFLPRDRSGRETSPTSGGFLPQTEQARPAAHLFTETGFVTPPFSSFVTVPIAFMALKKAYLAWQLIIVGVTALSIYFALRISSPQPAPELFPVLLFAALYLYAPFHEEAYLGNINSLSLLSWVLGVYFLAQRRQTVSALCFAVGTMLKVFPAVAVLLMALRRQWKWTIAYAAWCASLLALSVWRLGWDNHATWLSAVYPALSCGLSDHFNRSLPGLILVAAPQCLHSPCHISGWVCTFNKTLSVALLCLFLGWCWKKGKGSEGLVHELCVLPMVCLLISPLSWQAHFIVAALPLTYLWIRCRKSGLRGAKVDVVLLMLATLTFGTVVPEATLLSSRHTHLSAVALVALWVAATVMTIWVGLRTYDLGPDALETAPMGGPH